MFSSRGVSLFLALKFGSWGRGGGVHRMLDNRFKTAEFRGSFQAWQGGRIKPRQWPSRTLSPGDLSLCSLS